MPGHQLRPVGLEFLEEAPTRLEFEAEVRAPAPVVFGAISADPSTWTWFPGISEGSYTSAAPHGEGSIRQVRMGDSSYRETILAWEEPWRWAYRVDETTDDLAAAMAEDWVVEERDETVVVHWTLAVDPAPGFLQDIETVRKVIGEVFSTAMRNLGEHLAA